MQTKPVDFHPPSEEAPAILLPVEAGVFADRAARFEALAPGHSLSDWLAFLGHLTRAQHLALQALPALPPDEAALEQARRHGMPPLRLELPPPVWRDVLRDIIAVVGPLAPPAARPRLDGLAAAPEERLQALARAVLEGRPDPQDTAELPLVAAALQVVWTALAARIDAASLHPQDTPSLCPCCGSLPVASIVRISSGVNNLRYLHCSLCNTEWNRPRATCTACGSDRDVAYQQIGGAEQKAAVRAETCDGCKSYLKIVYQEKDVRIDPVADDLATLALDLLLDEAGYGRAGPNLLLFGGGGG